MSYYSMLQGASILRLKTSFEDVGGSMRSVIHLTTDTGFEYDVFYEFSGECIPKIKCDGSFAIVALLPFAMHHGVDIEIEEPVDAVILEKLEESQDAWRRWFPDLFRNIRIIAPNVLFPEVPPRGRSAVAAFSGGIDACYALHAHKRGLLGRRTCDVKGAVLVQGFDIPLTDGAWYAMSRDHAAAIAEYYDTPLVEVRTNWRDLENMLFPDSWEMIFMYGLAGIMHQFKTAGVEHAVIAADEPYDGEIAGWGSNSITNQMMGSDAFPIHFTGGGEGRSGKARVLSGEPGVLEHLRVCWQRGENGKRELLNCGVCEKCMRTKLNFMAHGVDKVPALGAAQVTAAEVRRIMIGNPAILSLYKEMLADGDWSGYPDVKRELERLVAKGVRKPRRGFGLKKALKKVLKKLGV